MVKSFGPVGPRWPNYRWTSGPLDKGTGEEEYYNFYGNARYILVAFQGIHCYQKYYCLCTFAKKF